MCRYLINEVMLGKRSVGFEVYSAETEDIIGMTAKQVKDSITSGKAVRGFIVDESGELKTDIEFIKNYMVKSGIGSLTPKMDTDCIVNIMYTVVGKKGANFEVVTSRFYHGTASEERIKVLYDMGAVNGVYIDAKGRVQLIDEVKKALDEKGAKVESKKAIKDTDETVKTKQ